MIEFENGGYIQPFEQIPGPVNPPFQGWGYSPDFMKQMEQSMLRISEANEKISFAEDKRVETARKKLMLKEAYAERKRGLVEVIEVSDSGALEVVTRNLAIQSRPRRISNMSKPEVVTLLRAKNPKTQRAYVLTCWVENRKIEIFLNPEKIGKGNYLHEKMVREGIYYEFRSNSKLKQMLMGFVARLISQSEMSVLVYECAGWHKQSDGEFRFVKEGELTWQIVNELVR